MDVSGETRIGRGRAIDRIERERHQHQHAEKIGNAKPQGTVAEELARSLPRKARPGEQRRKKEQQHHQADVLPCAEYVEAEPTITIDDREGPPQIWRLVERVRGRRRGTEIGQGGVEHQNDQGNDSAQIIER